MKIGVYGLGRFGKFWAELLAQKFDNVMAYSRTPGKVLPAGVEWVELEELLEADALFLCVSISSFEEVLRSIAGKLKPGMVVFDTCSVKAYPAQLMQRELPATVECVATHPMFGPDSGKNGVQGLPMVMHPLRCDEKRYRFWKDVFTSYEMDVIEMTPDEHDHQAAYTQGVTHFVGRVLQRLDLKECRIGTLGYHKLLEIVEQTCNDPLQLFHDLQRYNSYTGEMRNAVLESFQYTLKMLEEDMR
jgi:prephenate dehydrogenase